MAAGAHIRIDQATNPVPTGTYDQGRDDIRQAVQVQLVGDANSGLNVSPQWTLLDKPAGATAALTGGSTFTPTLTGDKPGPYRAQLLVNDGLAANAQIKVFRVTVDANGLIIDDACATPAFGELSSEGNAGGNARGYAPSVESTLANVVPTVANLAALRTRLASKHKHVHLLGYTTAGDGGGGLFYWDATSTATDNGGTIIQPGFGTGGALATGRWARQYAGALRPEWFGSRGNGKVVTDLTVSGTAATSAAQAQFTTADVGKLITIENAPSNPSTGTVAISVGGYVVGTGTHFLSEYVPFDLIYINGVAYVVNFVQTDTLINITHQTAVVAAGKTAYRGVRWCTTIAAYVSATQVTLAAGVPVAIAAPVEACFGSDDSVALRNCHLAAVACGKDVAYPAGYFCVTENLGFTNAKHIRVNGVGMSLTTLRDMRDWLGAGTHTGATYYGVLSFKNCSRVAVRDLTIRGVCAEPVGASLTTDLGRKGIYLDTYQSLRISKVRIENTRDEAIFGFSNTINSSACIEACELDNLNTNGINIGDGIVAIAGTKLSVVNNHVTNCGGYSLSNGADACVQTGNCLTYNKPYLCGATQVLLYPQNNSIFDGNFFIGFDSRNSGGALIDVSNLDGMVAASADVTTSIRGNHFIRCQGLWYSGQSGAIHIENLGGSADIAHNVFAKCGESYATYAYEMRFICVRGTGTGKINIHDNNFNNFATYNMRIGVEVEASVPAGQVAVGPNVYTNVPVPLVLGAGLLPALEHLVVSATGTTVVGAIVKTILVTANGAVTLTLCNPALVPGRMLRIKNDSTQAGTTTVGTAASTIDGGATVARTGAQRGLTVWSDGVQWRVETLYL